MPPRSVTFRRIVVAGKRAGGEMMIFCDFMYVILWWFYDDFMWFSHVVQVLAFCVVNIAQDLLISPEFLTFQYRIKEITGENDIHVGACAFSSHFYQKSREIQTKISRKWHISFVNFNPNDDFVVIVFGLPHRRGSLRTQTCDRSWCSRPLQSHAVDVSEIASDQQVDASPPLCVKKWDNLWYWKERLVGVRVLGRD